MAMHDNNVIPLDSRTTGGERKKAQVLLDESRAITLRYLPTLLKRMLDNADDTLFELADKAESNLLQASYFDAMRQLRLQRQALEEAFQQRIEAEFKHFFAAPSVAKKAPTMDFSNADSMTLTLLDKSDLEESLAISTMIAKVNSRLARELYAIEQRFIALVSTKNIDLDVIPIAPRAICEAFRESLKQFDVDTNIKLIIYKLFDKYVASHLAPLYDENNTLFAEAGVLPNLKMTVKKQPRSAQNSTTQPPHSDNGDTSFTDTPTGQSLENGAGYHQTGNEALLGTLQQLLAQQRATNIANNHATSHNQAGNSATAHIDPIDLVNALSSIQLRDIRFESFESVAQLKEALSSEIQTTVSGGKLTLLSPVDNDIIDIVAMLFDFILDDSSLPSVAKALISRLQIPLLKVAISDNAFFSKKQHPARRLLNQMAQSAMGIDEETRIDGSPLLQKIDYIVNRILNDFQDNIALFDELLLEFERFQSLSEVQESRTQATSKKQYELREKQKLTSAWVMDCIATRIQEKKLPKAVYELISGPWREVMVQTYLNDSDESLRWKEQLRFVDLLVWSVEPKKSDADKKRLSNILLELVITLQDGLKSIHLPQVETEHLLTALESCHIASMRGENSPDHSPSIRIKIDTRIAAEGELDEIDRALAEMQSQLNEMSKLEEMLNIPLLDLDDVVTSANRHLNIDEITIADVMIDDDDDVEEITITSGVIHGKIEPLINDEYWQQVLDLKTGEWLTLENDSGKQQRLRLVWKSDYLGECTFSNWKFKVVAEHSFNDLAAKFRRGEAEVVESLPLFERTIDAVMNTLHQRNVATAD